MNLASAPKPGGRLLTVAQAAKQLELSVAMVRRYCSNGQLAASKVGRDWAIRQRDIDAFVAVERQQQKVGRQAHAQPA